MDTHTVIVAKLDLADEKQRFIQGAIHRTHTGRWPLFRAFGMVQIGRFIYEAAQWRTPLGRPPQYSLLRWDIETCGVSWWPARSHAAALSALRTVH